MTSTDTVLAAVAEPNRRRILDLLVLRPQPVGELVRSLGLSQPSTSKHLRVLRDSGLVAASTRGKQRVYALRAEPFQELDGWLQGYRRLWSSSLDRLEAALNEEQR